MTPDVDSGILRTLDRVRPGERFVLTGGIGDRGLEGGIGYRPKTWFDVAGYAEYQWGGSGWRYGARAAVHF